MIKKVFCQTVEWNELTLTKLNHSPPFISLKSIVFVTMLSLDITCVTKFLT